jgi:hypothetical protein
MGYMLVKAYRRRSERAERRSLDSLRSLGMTAAGDGCVIPSGARSAESRNLYVTSARSADPSTRCAHSG